MERFIDPSTLVLPGVSFKGRLHTGPFVLIGQQSTEGGSDVTELGDDAIIRSHSVIYAGTVIGSGFRTGHGALVREFCRISDNVSIGSGSVVEHHVVIGNRVRIHSGAFIPEYSVLEDDCWVGPNVVLTNAKYPCSSGVKDRLQGPVIASGAKIGANATILPGIRVGKNALVGAGSVVTRNVPEGAVMAGNPAVIINDVSRLPYTTGFKDEDSAG
jgi:acetyltransferase-like isoleucine patch superfamily enzyme